MNLILEPLTISALTNMGADQLMVRHQSDLNTARKYYTAQMLSKSATRNPG